MNKLILGALAALVFTPAFAQKITTGNMIPVANYNNQSSFSCRDPSGKSVDSTMQYGARKKDAGGFTGGIYQLSFASKSVASEDLKRINAAVSGRIVDAVSASCGSDGSMRILVKLWDPSQEEAKRFSWIGIYKDANGSISVK